MQVVLGFHTRARHVLRLGGDPLQCGFAPVQNAYHIKVWKLPATEASTDLNAFRSNREDYMLLLLALRAS